MKKKIILAISAVVLSAIAIVALCSFNSASNATELDPVSVHIRSPGKGPPRVRLLPGAQ